MWNVSIAALAVHFSSFKKFFPKIFPPPIPTPPLTSFPSAFSPVSSYQSWWLTWRLSFPLSGWTDLLSSELEPLEQSPFLRKTLCGDTVSQCKVTAIALYGQFQWIRSKHTHTQTHTLSKVKRMCVSINKLSIHSKKVKIWKHKAFIIDAMLI